MSVQDTTDILDRLAGVVPGSALDALRRERPQTRDNVQASYAALFEAPDETGVTPSERLAVASFVALLHGGVPAAAQTTSWSSSERSARTRVRVRCPKGGTPPMA